MLVKAREVGELRERTVGDGAAIEAAAAAVAAGGKVLAFGNGGSATDAMDLVADLRSAGVRALDLTDDSAILTALANDVGPEVLFQRQVIAHGREGDVAVAFSTSGGSANILLALEEARRRGLETVAIVGYDGGRIAAEGLADHVLIAPSEYIPRIQEAHATAYHLLCELAAATSTRAELATAQLSGAVATPTIAGRVKRGALGSSVCSTSPTAKPAASMELSVGRLQSQPTRKWLRPFIRSWRRATDGVVGADVLEEEQPPPGSEHAAQLA